MLWLACADVGPYITLWLDVTEVGPYRTLWLAGTEVGPYRTLWLAGTEVGPYRTLWLDGVASRSVGTIWLDGFASRSVGTIWLGGFYSRSWLERSDWIFWRSVFGRLRWTSCLANSDSSLRRKRKRYAKYVLFYVKIAFQPAVLRKTNKRASLFNITYSTRGGVTLLCTLLNDGAR